MLRMLRSGSRWLMILLIGAIGLVFTLYLGFQGSFTAAEETDVVVRVGERSFDRWDVQRVRQGIETQYRQAMGDNFDAKAAAAFLDESAASALLRAGLLSHEAQRLGLVASDGEVRNYLRSLPGVRGEDGSIDREAVRDFAEREYGSLVRFQEFLRDDLLQQKVQRLIWQSLDVSDAEALEAMRYAREEIEIAYLVFDGGKRPEGLGASEEAVQALLADDTERIQEAYDKRKDEFDKPEQVRARHILIRKGEDESEEEARARIDAARARVEAGEDFALVATELSEDPGSKERGGDLDFFGRGRMVKEFEDVAFSLEPGVLSDVVESSFGYHVIQVEEKKAAELVTFEQAREQIARDLALTDATEQAARTRAEEVAAKVAGGQSLVDAARDAELTLSRPDPLRRRPDGFVPELGAAPDVVRAAFALTLDAPSDPTVHEVGDRKFVLVQLLGRTLPSDEDLEQGLAAERTRLLQERRESTQRTWLEGVREELIAEEALVYDLSAMN